MNMRVALWRKLSAEELMVLNCCVGEDSWESLGSQGNPPSSFWRRSALGFLWKEWCWSWNSSTLATSCEELTHWKRLWCWEGLGARVEGDDRGWVGWMASLTRWTWVWVNSGSWWWTERPDMLRFMGSQTVGHDWETDLIWSDQPWDLSSVLRIQNYWCYCNSGTKTQRPWGQFQIFISFLNSWHQVTLKRDSKVSMPTWKSNPKLRPASSA